ncbi:MAG: hypothetical protein PV344_02385, partial [Anaplasma sp.]|nr:hypothetical protein [Anaplasma sp.]
MWHSSLVIPVFDRSKVNNYRPVSLLCTLSNVFEILLHNGLYAHFREKIVPRTARIFEKSFGGDEFVFFSA